MTDPVGEAIDLFEHTLDKTALVWFQTNRSKFKDLTTLKMKFLQRYNPWGKTKREQLQSWNILSFIIYHVDEHIDLINTLGDMVDQKEEAKKATVPGLYSHIAHSVDKDEGEIPQPFKGTKPKQTR